MTEARLVDSHCHLDRLDLEPFGGTIAGVIADAAEQGVGHMLCVCIDMDNFADVTAIAREFPNVWASVGVHPNEQESRVPDTDELAKLAGDERIVAIGETGLDYFRSEGDDLEWQRDRFRSHIRAARLADKPLIIHSRAAREDTIRLMAEEGADAVGGVMHCFVEDWATAERAMELGFYISFSGIVTFRNAAELKEVAKRVPLERLLVETDSPYLAPVPNRGKENRPAWVRHVAEHIAELRGISLDEVTRATTENFFRLFRISPVGP